MNIGVFSQELFETEIKLENDESVQILSKILASLLSNLTTFKLLHPASFQE